MQDSRNGIGVDPLSLDSDGNNFPCLYPHTCRVHLFVSYQCCCILTGSEFSSSHTNLASHVLMGSGSCEIQKLGTNGSSNSDQSSDSDKSVSICCCPSETCTYQGHPLFRISVMSTIKNLKHPSEGRHLLVRSRKR